MNVTIQTQGFDITPPIGARVHRQVNKLLQTYAEDIVSVEVYLRDLNGPKGGPDKQVGIRIHVRHLPPQMVMTTEADLYKAIDRSAARAGRAVERAIGRFRRIRRRGLHHFGVVPSQA
jgi:ribosome-associated translation inhibitor RaiA